MSYLIYQYFVRLFYTLSVFMYKTLLLYITVNPFHPWCSHTFRRHPLRLTRCSRSVWISAILTTMIRGFLDRGTVSCPRDFRVDQGLGTTADFAVVNKLRFQLNLGKIGRSSN